MAIIANKSSATTARVCSNMEDAGSQFRCRSSLHGYNEFPRLLTHSPPWMCPSSTAPPASFSSESDTSTSMSPESSRKTHSAPEGVKVYADGSFYKQFNLGAWAYRVPVLGLAESGVGSGHSSKHFELQAAVLAISAADRALGGGSAI